MATTEFWEHGILNRYIIEAFFGKPTEVVERRAKGSPQLEVES